MAELKLFMLLLGCKPPGRHTEQHDIFFAIAGSLNELVPAIRSFWPEPERIHIDAWREVTAVDDFRVTVHEGPAGNKQSPGRLFFINLGGYQPNKFEEQHYPVLTVKPDRAAAFREAKETLFFKHNHFEDANAHIDDKYGIDVDDLYEIEEILSPRQKNSYHIRLTPQTGLPGDEVHLGYLKLSELE
ncbi:DUF1543 domain-containing protein [Hufsiella ginkgonis]|uniref:DUF1543 domain-containing protein n=1 Tax=Hufsiella ginkgonis TaxID=2695274 RepID=A0A7K1XY50_9SPHI|nr:DUF1543 domain-containing protein [Hufsiella ginkgonis]MXV15767.1 DUF1543 domain-containing protein [Hufsiella ginkgonis]